MPKAFADEAVAAFGSSIVKIREAELEPFYNDHVAKHMSELDVDTNQVEVIKILRDSGEPDEQWMIDSMDRNNDRPGIRINQRKTFARYKALTNLNVVQ